VVEEVDELGDRPFVDDADGVVELGEEVDEGVELDAGFELDEGIELDVP
jgi:hypothetical protein